VPTKLKLTIAAFVIFLLAFVRYQLWLKEQPHYSEGEKVQLSGYLQEEPKRKERLDQFRFESVRVITDQEVHYGDYLVVSGELKNSSLFMPEIKIEQRGFFLTKLLSQIRLASLEKINQILPEPEAGLANGILLGNKADLNSDLVQALKTTGTIHVVVVSGYNITVVGGLFLLLSPLIKRKKALILALSAVIFYSLMTGLSAPTLRALIMASIAYLGVYFGRVVYPLYVLFLVFLIAYFIDPGIVFDIGFELSFLATAGILLLSKKLESVFGLFPRLIRIDFSSSIAAQLFVVPVIFFYFGSISPIAPLANLLTLWVIPFVTIVGFVILGISFIYLPLAHLGGLLILVPLKYFTFSVTLLSKVPLASLSVEKQNPLLLIGYLFLLAFIASVLWRKGEVKLP
jgi:competence protein ComEC